MTRRHRDFASALLLNNAHDINQAVILHDIIIRFTTQLAMKLIARSSAAIHAVFIVLRICRANVSRLDKRTGGVHENRSVINMQCE